MANFETEEAPNEIKKWREAVRKTVEAVISLCPAYNILVQRLRSIQGMRTSEAARLYPELFHPDGVKIFSELLGVELGTEVRLSYNGLAYKLVEFSTAIEDLFEREDVRKVLEESIGMRLEKTPLQDYVELCIDALKDDKIALAALKILAEKGYTCNYERELIPEMKEKYGIECSKDDLIKSLGKASSLGLLSIFRDNEASINSRYAKHVKEVIRLEPSS